MSASASTGSTAGATGPSVCGWPTRSTSGCGSTPVSKTKPSRHGSSKQPTARCTYVDGGITHNDGTLSKRFVRIEHDVEFDGDRKRPASAVLVFTDEDGATYRVTADAPHQHVNAYYGLPMSKCTVRGSRRRRLLHPLPMGQQRPRRTGRNRRQVDGDGSAHALRSRRQNRLGHLRNAHGRQGISAVPELAPDGHVVLQAGRRAGRSPARDRKSRR